MSGFNLNSDQYENHELEELLGLAKPYSDEDISNAKGILSEQLTSSDDLGPERKREILFFIDTIADRISNSAPHQRHHDDNEGTWAERQVPVKQYGSNVIITNPNEIVGRHAKITEGRLATEDCLVPAHYMHSGTHAVAQTSLLLPTRWVSLPRSAWQCALFVPNMWAGKQCRRTVCGCR